VQCLHKGRRLFRNRKSGFGGGAQGRGRRGGCGQDSSVPRRLGAVVGDGRNGSVEQSFQVCSGADDLVGQVARESSCETQQGPRTERDRAEISKAGTGRLIRGGISAGLTTAKLPECRPSRIPVCWRRPSKDV